MNPVRAGVLAGLTVAASVAVEFGPLAVALPGGLLLAFVLPGFALNEAIFRAGRKDIGMVERTVLVPSLSLAVLVLGGLGLWSVGGHLNRASWTLVCAVVTLLAIGLAFYRAQHRQPVTATPGRAPAAGKSLLSQERLIKDVLPLTLAVLLLGVAGVWSFADSVNTYDISVTSLSADPPGPVDSTGNRSVQVTAAGLDMSAGPYAMVLTGTNGTRLTTYDITPGTAGNWTGRLTVPGDQRVTVNLFRRGEAAALRTLIIAAVAR